MKQKRLTIVFLLPNRFPLYDEAGQEIIRMVATFVLMDRDDRKFMYPSNPEIVTSLSLIKLIRGPKSMLSDPEISKDYHVRFYDLDMVDVLITAKYLDWILKSQEQIFDQVYLKKSISSMSKRCDRWHDCLGL